MKFIDSHHNGSEEGRFLIAARAPQLASEPPRASDVGGWSFEGITFRGAKQKWKPYFVRGDSQVIQRKHGQP